MTEPTEQRGMKSPIFTRSDQRALAYFIEMVEARAAKNKAASWFKIGDFTRPAMMELKDEHNLID